MADINNKVARGVRKVNETITQSGRALILTEEQADKLNWSDIPVGSVRVNTSSTANGGGTWSVKLEGESDWVPGGIKNDGTINVVKDTRVSAENFTIKQLEIPDNKREFSYYIDGKDDEEHRRFGIILYENEFGACGEYNQYGTYPTWAECKRRLLIEDDSLEGSYRNVKKTGYVFTLERGDYAMYRHHLEVVIDNVLHRSASIGGVREISETRFCLTEEGLTEGMEISARYIHAFRLGNPYPRTFINPDEPEVAEAGDFWLDIDGNVNEEDPLTEDIDADGMIGWYRIRPSTRPSSLAGYGIKDKVSYQGHVHTVSDIVDFAAALSKEDTGVSTAGKALLAVRALSADKADTAAIATSADSATNATNDNIGRSITDTYVTKDELSATLKNKGVTIEASLEADGWTKLPNGFIMQWGHITDGNQNIIFPVEFPSSCVSITCSSEKNEASAAGFNNVYNVSKTGASVVLDGEAGYWMAFGY